MCLRALFIKELIPEGRRQRLTKSLSPSQCNSKCCVCNFGMKCEQCEKGLEWKMLSLKMLGKYLSPAAVWRALGMEIVCVRRTAW